MSSSLSNRVALVTGATRRVGIGAAIARELAAEDAAWITGQIIRSRGGE
jgi:NAD(P)-dependent dehydrogenase (short-subunit alcohol dehydrogenase family)